MAPSHEPLLSSPTNKKTSLPCKAFLFTLSLATIISLTTLITIHFSTTNPSQPSHLCATSPNPSSCNVIVSDALLLASTSAPLKPTPLDVFRAIADRSVAEINAAAAAAVDLRLRVRDPRQQSALADCAQLLDLSRDRLLAASATSSIADARTWTSAALTNYATCLDGAGAALHASVAPLKSLASAALAVLTAAGGKPSHDDDDVANLVLSFPSWVSHHDRKLLEATSAKDIKADVVVAADGSGKFKKVQEGVDSAPDKGTKRYVIYVKKGVYKENVSLGKKKTNVMIVGDGMDSTVISGSLNVVDGSTTFNSATLAAVGDGLILQDLKIENTAGPQKHQAVALRVGADRSAINRCRLDGYQDTLYAHSLRQFYRDSSISGTVDFIFGNAAVVFQNCDLVARRPMDKQKNLVTAQGREDPNQNTGTSIQSCHVTPSADLAPVKKQFPTYLGRPWKAYSRTVFLQSTIEDHVDPKGWLEWDGEFALKTLFYGEYQNRGPGAGTAGRVKWPGYNVITDPEVAKRFTVASLIQGGAWLKGTGVAFTEGL
ncbi:pectinesterase-like [Typha latifolia]|uniref:pectinesterase-like n=1 Tax=Typha latifolia TaxID=4733 RepID=UPI003C2B141A